MATNSRVQATGVGKDSKRHDLDGTPGLTDSDLQQGDVQQLEAGQKAVQNTVNQPVQAQAGPATPQARRTSNINVPDAVQFAKQKLGGSNLDDAGREVLAPADMSRWLPLLERLAVSPTASGLLQRAYIDNLSAKMNKPIGGQAVVIRQRDFDKRLEEFNAS